MSDDLKAPKRIWASRSASGKCHVCFDTPSLEYANEYVRADLFNKAVDEMTWALPVLEKYIAHPNDHWKLDCFRAVLAELEGE
jgi:hypothetical protein